VIAAGAFVVFQITAALLVGGEGFFFVLLGSVATALALLLASWLLMERLEGRPVAALGLPLDRLTFPACLRGFGLGVLLMAAVVGLLAVSGSLRWVADPDAPLAVGSLAASLVGLTAFYFVAGFAEELLLRGYPLQALAEKAGGTVAIVATSVVFAALHYFNPGIRPDANGLGATQGLALLNIGLAGGILGLAYWRTFSLWFATGVHAGWNWLMGFAADLPVSGIEPGVAGYAFFDTPGWDVVVDGPALWTGGAVGPEGGLAVTGVSIAALVWLGSTDRLSRSLRVRAMGTLPDAGSRPGPRSDAERSGPVGERDGEEAGWRRTS
jgi:membrane protease YdiL (CAAX protease family)